MKARVLSAYICGAGLLALVAPALAQPDPGADVTTADPTAPAGTAAAPDANADAEAEAMALALAGSSSEATSAAVADTEEFKLNIYGFTDFTYSARFSDFAFASPYPAFMVGNVNLYVGAELGKGWRSLTEFRLLYSPHGNQPLNNDLSAGVRQDTTVADPADYGRPLRWGGVEIERAWLEYSAHPLLTIQAGQWLTPYGIWNVDHGSPVIIGARRPFVVGEALFPERQTGVQLYGSYLVGTTEIGYHLGLSNGRGPIDAFADLDKNKAFTARLSVSNESPVGTITLGGTLYRGRYTDRSLSYYISNEGRLGVEYIASSRYEELGLGADLRWIWNDLSVQGELITREVAYQREELRPAALALPGQPAGFAPDFRSVGWYVLGAYRLPWYNVMPFFGGESYHPNNGPLGATAAIWGGLNVRPIPRVTLKAQVTHAWGLVDEGTVGDNYFNTIDLQAGWSF